MESQLPETAKPEMHLADVLERIGAQARRVADIAAEPRIHGALIRDLAALATDVEIDVHVEFDDETSTPEDPDSG